MIALVQERPQDTLRVERLRVLARHARKCACCGRRCGELDVRPLDTAAGEAGLAPVCPACVREMLAGAGPPPRPRFGLLLFAVTDALTILYFALWGVFAAAAVYMLRHLPLNPFLVLGEAVLILYLLYWAQLLAVRVRDETRERADRRLAREIESERESS